nr:transglutaminase-like domain-containing protein [Legionella pneumophila]
MTLWAKQQFAKVNYDPKAFIEFIQNYIKEESYWYTLTPPKLENQNDQMDYFWFDSRKGFCEHYASAVTVILRSVGIPARVIVGYQGGEWNPLARYLTIKQYDAHAWLEYWQKESGWKQLDPTSFISPSRIEPSILAMQAARAKQQLVIDPSRLTWLQKLKLYMESTRFFIERWLLFYNQDTQYELLEKIGLRHWNAVNLLQIVIISLVLFIIFLGVCYQWRQKRILDPLLHEYHLLQKEFCRFNIPTQPPTTLNQQCKILVNKIPNLEETITTFLYHYEKLRLQHRLGKEKENKKQAILLFKNLRRILKQVIA